MHIGESMNEKLPLKADCEWFALRHVSVTMFGVSDS